MKKPTRTVWARVKEALKDASLPTTQNEAARIARVEQPSVSGWNKPGVGPELQNGLRLANRLGVCVEWLYTERGPKLPGNRPDDEHAEALWSLWPRIDDDVKRDLVGAARVKARPPSNETGEGDIRAAQTFQNSKS